jgi:hypothetical protein
MKFDEGDLPDWFHAYIEQLKKHAAEAAGKTIGKYFKGPDDAE